MTHEEYILEIERLEALNRNTTWKLTLASIFIIIASLIVIAAAVKDYFKSENTEISSAIVERL
jgi:hypothetical protein